MLSVWQKTKRLTKLMMARYEEAVLLLISISETNLTSTRSDSVTSVKILNAYNYYLAIISQKHKTKKERTEPQGTLNEKQKLRIVNIKNYHSYFLKKIHRNLYL